MDTVMALAFIKESALQMRLFASLCNALGEYRIAPSEVRWHTCGRVWSCVMVKTVQSSLHISVAVSSERKWHIVFYFCMLIFFVKNKKQKKGAILYRAAVKMPYCFNVNLKNTFPRLTPGKGTLDVVPIPNASDSSSWEAVSKISLDGHSQTAYTRKRMSESISFSSRFITSSGDAEPFVFSKINELCILLICLKSK